MMIQVVWSPVLLFFCNLVKALFGGKRHTPHSQNKDKNNYFHHLHLPQFEKDLFFIK